VTAPDVTAPAQPDLVERLTAHRLLGGAPRAELEWLAAHGVLRTLDTGEVLNSRGAQIQGLYIVLRGRFALFIDRGAGPSKVLEWGEGEVSGLLPYSRLVIVPGESRALEPLEVLTIARDDLRAMTRDCFEVTTLLVHTMLDRTRELTASDLQDEKMISLGKLSAGLAHELNNPASAIERCASTLGQRIQESEQATRDLAQALLGDAPAQALDAVRASCVSQAPHPLRSPLDQMDREDTLAGWLSARSLDTTLAGPLADTHLTLEALDQLTSILPQPAWNSALHWVAAGTSARTLSAEIQDCSTRISRLVNAVKGFTHMDQANVAELLDLAPSLHDTVAVLSSRAQEKSVSISVQVEPELPQVRAFAAELNQIWGNLLENALDAVAPGGHIQIRAVREGQFVAVHIGDDGPGIPPEIRDRIFDPFFTTRPQGQGIGLGLDIARRLARHNDTVITFESEPGRTEFTVRLPLT
jgi:signal transduction histidine kinase